MNKSLLRDFKSPPNQYRGAPFWAWNGHLEEPELRRQIRIMQRMGLGGFFMHARVGLETPYLSDEFMDCVGACVDEAERLGMQAWLYDEDRWPSGFAGGLVTRKKEFRKRTLALEVLDSPSKLKWNKDLVAAFAGKLDGQAASQVRRIGRNSRPRGLEKGQKILAFRVVIDEPSDYYNGFTYVDTLNKRAIAEFLRVTHEAYRRRFGKHFGRRIPGIFTDEPNHGGKFWAFISPSDRDVPWTDELPAAFRRRYGYDLLDHLVEVFFDVDGRPTSPAHLHYHDCVTEMFVDGYSRQIGQWCDKHGLLHTGHVLFEDSLSSQTAMVGSTMRFYEYKQARAWTC